MSTIIIAAIIVGSVVFISLLLISIHNKEKRIAMNNLLKYFNQLGTENDFNISSQEILNSCILGLDGVHRKILVVTKEDGYLGSFIIDLNQVKTCLIKKIYGTINQDDLKKHKMDQFLEKITLHFDLNNKPSVEIVFYNHFENHIYEAYELEQKAKHWEIILSKMKAPLKNSIQGMQ
ncbi:MAG: hypothetical protein ACJ748_01745 [Flavisolibacter sp.]